MTSKLTAIFTKEKTIAIDLQSFSLNEVMIHFVEKESRGDFSIQERINDNEVILVKADQRYKTIHHCQYLPEVGQINIKSRYDKGAYFNYLYMLMVLPLLFGERETKTLTLFLLLELGVFTMVSAILYFGMLHDASEARREIINRINYKFRQR